jgi:hypothetical protein
MRLEGWNSPPGQINFKPTPLHDGGGQPREYCVRVSSRDGAGSTGNLGANFNQGNRLARTLPGGFAPSTLFGQVGTYRARACGTPSKGTGFKSRRLSSPLHPEPKEYHERG